MLQIPSLPLIYIIIRLVYTKIPRRKTIMTTIITSTLTPPPTTTITITILLTIMKNVTIIIIIAVVSQVLLAHKYLQKDTEQHPLSKLSCAYTSVCRAWQVHTQVFFLHADCAHQNRDFTCQTKLSTLHILRRQQ